MRLTPVAEIPGCVPAVAPSADLAADRRPLLSPSAVFVFTWHDWGRIGSGVVREAGHADAAGARPVRSAAGAQDMPPVECEVVIRQMGGNRECGMCVSSVFALDCIVVVDTFMY